MDWTDETKMTFGKYEGKKLANVPASYLMWWYSNADYNTQMYYKGLRNYITNNYDLLVKQASRGDRR